MLERAKHFFSRISAQTGALRFLHVFPRPCTRRCVPGESSGRLSPGRGKRPYLSAESPPVRFSTAKWILGRVCQIPHPRTSPRSQEDQPADPPLDAANREMCVLRKSQYRNSKAPFPPYIGLLHAKSSTEERLRSFATDI